MCTIPLNPVPLLKHCTSSIALDAISMSLCVILITVALSRFSRYVVMRYARSFMLGIDILIALIINLVPLSL